MTNISYYVFYCRKQHKINKAEHRFILFQTILSYLTYLILSYYY
jgi:hypothetical protein